jgi:phosphohistidine phosphatase SixA
MQPRWVVTPEKQTNKQTTAAAEFTIFETLLRIKFEGISTVRCSHSTDIYCGNHHAVVQSIRSINDKLAIMPTIQIWPLVKVLFQYLCGGANREIPLGDVTVLPLLNTKLELSKYETETVTS